MRKLGSKKRQRALRALNILAISVILASSLVILEYRSHVVEKSYTYISTMLSTTGKGYDISAGDSLLGTFDSASCVDKSLVGTNFISNGRSGPQVLFTDVLKQSDEWVVCLGSSYWTCGDNMGVPIPDVPVDDVTGYPLQVPFSSGGTSFGVRTYAMGHSSYPTGVYTFIVEGSGTVHLKMNSVNSNFDAPGVYPVTVTDPSELLTINILSSDVNNPVRNMHFIMPGFEDSYETDLFYPLFLERLGNLGTLRMMKLQHIDEGNPTTTWESRTTPAYHTQNTLKGVALEYLINMANTLHKDIWLNIPEKATDDYIYNFAVMVRDNFDPDLKVYIEYSNELWNTGVGFPQGTWIMNAGCEMHLNYDADDGGDCYNYDCATSNNPTCDSDKWPSKRAYWAKRMTETFSIFDDVFSSASDEDRLIKVIAGQAGYIDLSRQVLDATYTDYIWNGAENVPINPDGVRADAYASAPYFGDVITTDATGNARASAILAMGEDAYLDEISAVEIPNMIQRMKDNKALADSYDLTYITYEGGQHFLDLRKQTDMINFFISINRNPRMKDLYTQYLQGWFDNVGNLFVHFNYIFNPSQYGTWGSLESLDQSYDTAYKYQALMEMADSHMVSVCGGSCTDGETQLCSNQVGVCSGSFETCASSSWPGCDYSSIPNYQATESSCSDTLDNDCDSFVDCDDSDCSGDAACISNKVERRNTATNQLLATYDTITSCASAVTEGQTCLVYPGEYHEQVNVNSKSNVVFKSTEKYGAVVIGDSIRNYGFNIANSNHITVDGFHIMNFTKTILYASGVYVTGGSYIEIMNNKITDVYYHENPWPEDEWAWADDQHGNGIYFYGCGSYSKIHDNIVMDTANSGIRVVSVSNGVTEGIEVYNNNVSYANIGFRFSAADNYGVLRNISLHDNNFFGFGNYIYDESQGSSFPWHRDGVHLFPGGSRNGNYLEDIKIYNNFFTDDTDVLRDKGSTGWIFGEGDIRNSVIYNNVLHKCDGGICVWIQVQNDGGNFNISNNVIYGISPFGDTAQALYIAQTPGVKLYNNIIIGTTRAYNIVDSLSMTGFEADNNILYSPGNTNVVKLNGVEYSLTGLKSQGFETNGYNVLPDFVGDPETYYSDPSVFKLNKGSVGIDVGTDVSVDFDFDNNVRPQGSGYDIGAYEKTQNNAINGVLRVSSTNPRYFTDDTGKAIYLTGMHTWANLQDYESDNPLGFPVPFDYTGYLDLMESYNQNFIREWAWEYPFATVGVYQNPILLMDPLPWERSATCCAEDGENKFDLDQLNPDYFTRLRARAIEAGERGMYFSIMLFNGFSTENKGGQNPWIYHPFNAGNNINGVDGDYFVVDGEGKEIHEIHEPEGDEILAYQKAYVAEVIDSLYDLDNVLFEIGNELHGNSEVFQNYFVDYIKNYELNTYGVNHPVGMTFEYPDGTTSELYVGNADWISPGPTDLGYNNRYHPRPASGTKVILMDTDHVFGIGGNSSWVWRVFTRGNNILYMTSLGNEYFNYYERFTEEANIAMGQTNTIAQNIDLVNMVPSSTATNTQYALIPLSSTSSNPEYLLYAPDGGSITLNDLYYTEDDLNVIWFDPANNQAYNLGTVSGSGPKTFPQQFTGQSVLYIGKGNPWDVSGCIDGETQLCSVQLGVCSGSFETCASSSWPGCDYGAISGYETTEATCDDTLDNDCDGSADNDDSDCVVCIDNDLDGYGVCPDCGIVNECINDGDDCDDSNQDINPGATEICDDIIDNDCDSFADCDDSDCSAFCIILPDLYSYETSSAVTIDGGSSEWVSIGETILPYANLLSGFIDDNSDASAVIKSMWDDNYLYVMVEVTDDILSIDSGVQPWKDDSVELYLDGDNLKATTYDANDYQLVVGADGLNMGGTNSGAITGLLYAAQSTANGYNVEYAVPFTGLGFFPSVGSILGFDIGLNDDDDGDVRDGQLMLYGDDNNWADPSGFGNIELAEARECLVDGDCNDDNSCTDDSCVDHVCVNIADDTNTCNDNQFCTLNDRCSGGSCVGDSNPCSDAFECTGDSCDEANDQCIHNLGGCDCLTNADCNDANPCTDDSCIGYSCVNIPDDTNTCDDNQFCTLNDRCSSGSCITDARLCTDGQDCTIDSCDDELDTCIFEAIDADTDGYSICPGVAQDCKDDDPNINPGATEICNGIDENCINGADDGFTAEDCEETCSVSGGVDFNPSRGADLRCCGNDAFEDDPYQITEQICDGNDNNCNGVIDEITLTDPDNCGSCGNVCNLANVDVHNCISGACNIVSCDPGWTDLNDDPLDGCEYVCTPTGAEVCDGVDNDCNGQTDEGFTAEDCEEKCFAAGGSNYNTGRGPTFKCCGNEAFEDDPYELTEQSCDGNDNDCDGVIDEMTMSDPANCGSCGNLCDLLNVDVHDCVSGTCSIVTCDSGWYDLDNNPENGCEYACNPNNLIELCDGVDNDCNGQTDEGFTAEDCEETCFVAGGSDYDVNRGSDLKCCGDNSYEDNPYEVTEQSCDGNDNDCDGVIDEITLTDPNNCGSCGNVCDLANVAVHDCVSGTCGIVNCNPGYIDLNDDPVDGCEYVCTPSGPEVCDGIDNDCNGQTDEGFTAEDCEETCFVAGGSDYDVNRDSDLKCCGDNSYEDNPYEVTEQSCDGNDNDCDGIIDEVVEYDVDNCGSCGNVCDLANVAVHECVSSACTIMGCEENYYDLDNDPIDGCEYACIYESDESCEDGTGYDGKDNNCDGTIDLDCEDYCDKDGDGYSPHLICALAGYSTGDCNDTEASVNPGQPEICNGVDDDCDAETFDGNDEEWLGSSCDGPDYGLCEEGSYICQDAQAYCTDTTEDDLDLCNDMDDDCNPSTFDGQNESWFGESCGDLADGMFICENSTQFCFGATNISYTSNIHDLSLTVGESLSYDIDVTFSNASINTTCFGLNDTQNFKINCSGYLQNNGSLSVNLYDLNITFNDTQDITYYEDMLVRVNPVAPPPDEDSGGTSGGGGGAGGLPSPSSTDDVAIFSSTRTEAGETIEWELNADDIAIYKIVFEALQPLVLINIKVEKIDEAQAPDSIDYAYQYDRITTLRLNEDDITDPMFYFKVSNRWLEDYEADSVKLFRYDGSWRQLDTTLFQTNDNYHYYRSESPGFSYFAIAALEEKQIDEELPLGETQLSPPVEPSSDESDKIDLELQPEPESKHPNYLWLLLLFPIVLFVLFFVVRLHYNPDKSQHKIASYIEYCLSKGYNTKDIEKTLLKYGFKLEDVRKVEARLNIQQNKQQKH